MPFKEFWLLIYYLLLTAVYLRVLYKRRTVSASLAWFLVIFIVPVIGIIAYIAFGEIQLGSRRAQNAASLREPFIENLQQNLKQHAGPPPKDNAAAAVYALIHNAQSIGSIGYSDFSVISEPDKIFEQWLADIEQAQTSIRLEFYIWHPFGRVLAINQALIDAAKRGVKVELLADHAGSWRFFLLGKELKRMRDAGIEIVANLPVSLWRNVFRRVDIRMHRKILVIDHKICYSGSMNMADPDYFNQGRQVGAWIDMVMRFEGAAAFAVSKVFSWDWEVETSERRFPDIESELEPAEQWMSIIPSGPQMTPDIAAQVLLSAIYRADKSIRITTPYFVPSEAIYDALIQAARRGVHVQILLPAKGDSRMATWASRSYYEGLLDAGVEIRHFHSGLLHTKALLVDEKLAVVGSVNLDMRSLQLNFELSFAIWHKPACKELSSLLKNYQSQSTEVSSEQWEQRSTLHRLTERLMYFMSPLL